MSFVTAIGSFGYFLSPIFTSYSLIEFGWNYTLFVFGILLIAGLVAAYFVRSPSAIENIEKKSVLSLGIFYKYILFNFYLLDTKKMVACIPVFNYSCCFFKSIYCNIFLDEYILHLPLRYT